jgi:tRNA pseudouridine65 synthase
LSKGLPIELLYVDAHLVVANKPSGLLVHRGLANDDDVLLFRVRDALGQHVHLVQRLDRGTSGVIVIARTPAVAAALGVALADPRARKCYLALVRGKPPDEGVIDSPVPRSEDGERVPAVTRYRTVARSTVARCSLVEAHPETGRFHQIRRHLKHLGHPLIGDVNYGSGALNREYRAAHGLHRLGLHAYRVELDHPITGERLSVTAPVPDDLGRVLDALALPRGPGT